MNSLRCYTKSSNCLFLKQQCLLPFATTSFKMYPPFFNSNSSLGKCFNKNNKYSFGGVRFYSAKGPHIRQKLARKKLQRQELDEQIAEWDKPKVQELSLETPLMVRHFGTLMGMRPRNLLKYLPTGYTIDTMLSLETMEEICYNLNVLPKRVSPSDNYDPSLQVFSGKDDPKTCPPRAPVVTVMGHVDHGKTTLLDYLRKSNIVAKEHGGITQHIGAFEVSISKEDIITFIDTPGHEAFVKMRDAGAKITDIIIVVVAADDGVLQQTIEAINHAHSYDIPFIIAINKIDKFDANVDGVIQQLMKHNVYVTTKGGNVPVIEISALKGTNIEQLKEELVLMSMDLELCAKQKGCRAEASIIESKVDKGFGISASVIVRRGILKNGMWVVAGTTYGRIRHMNSCLGRAITNAVPSQPVELFGLNELPRVGEYLIQVSDQATARRIAEAKRYRERTESINVFASTVEKERLQIFSEVEKLQIVSDNPNDTIERIKMENLQMEEVDKRMNIDHRQHLALILKVDVQGTLDAFYQIISQFPTDTVTIDLISKGVGKVNEFDIDYAKSYNAQVVSMGQDIPEKIQRYARQHQVTFNSFRVIYHLIEYLKKELSKIIPETIKEEVLGEAKVLDTFDYSLKEGNKKTILKVAGSEVVKGVFMKDADLFKVMRWGSELYSKLDIVSLKHHKDSVNEVRQGTQCGIALEEVYEPKVDDVILCVKRHVIKPTFDDLIQKHKREMKEKSWKK